MAELLHSDYAKTNEFVFYPEVNEYFQKYFTDGESHKGLIH